MKKMILLFTPYSFNPLHPRLEYVEKCLWKNGYNIKKINLNPKNKNFFYRVNWLSLNFFQIASLFKSIKYLWRYRHKTDIVYLQDLQYLPIAVIAKFFNKKVIYETLDNNVELNFYHLSNRFEVFGKAWLLKRLFSSTEKFLSEYFCDEIIVNSKALVEYFGSDKVTLIYYTSPFENKVFIKENNEPVFLYLGGFWKMKGADIILDFIKKNNRKLFVFGSINRDENDILSKAKELKKKNLFVFMDRLCSTELIKQLSGLADKYRLIGFSLTQDVNLSNATQEINKDIDYLAMGIPIVGNRRIPTKEKIDAGCGVFIDEVEAVEKLLNDSKFYFEISKKCISYYNRLYSQAIFEKRLMEVVKKL